MPSLAGASPFEALVRQQSEDEDDHGNRLIRHVGPGLFLTSRVDAKGRLLRQELLLGQDFVVWQHGTRLRTGVCTDPALPQAAQYDASPSRTRIEKARLAAQRYLGRDRYIKHLARVLVTTAGLGMAGAEVVTVSPDAAAMAREMRRRQERPGPAWRRPLIVGVLLVLGALLIWVLRHHEG
jgi:hypothetical protein